MKAKYIRHDLIFKRPSGTSRGVLKEKETYFLQVDKNGKRGVGECALFRGLSSDDVPNYEEKLKWLCKNIDLPAEEIQKELQDFPSIWFGYEQAMLNLDHGQNLYFPSEFTNGKASITINGLIWMGNVVYMIEQIEQKLAEYFGCIKLKIGVNWSEEKEVLRQLRSKFPKEKLELRVDANGAFTTEQAKAVLAELAELNIHSIEQPIKAGDWKSMAEICANTPTPIALDEELIGIVDSKQKAELLETIKPQFIILKPSLVGGFSGSDKWIELAEKQNIGWWITSALESNIGLNAIAQYTFTKNNPMPQGLGTGALYTNNVASNLDLKGDQLWFSK